MVASKLIFQRLVCKDCDITADMRVNPDDPTNWPLHKCSKTRKAAPFSTVIGVPKTPARNWDDWAEDDGEREERLAAARDLRIGYGNVPSQGGRIKII